MGLVDPLVVVNYLPYGIKLSFINSHIDHACMLLMWNMFLRGACLCIFISFTARSTVFHIFKIKAPMFTTVLFFQVLFSDIIRYQKCPNYPCHCEVKGTTYMINVSYIYITFSYLLLVLQYWNLLNTMGFFHRYIFATTYVNTSLTLKRVTIHTLITIPAPSYLHPATKLPRR